MNAKTSIRLKVAILSVLALTMSAAFNVLLHGGFHWPAWIGSAAVLIAVSGWWLVFPESLQAAETARRLRRGRRRDAVAPIILAVLLGLLMLGLALSFVGASVSGRV